MRNRLAISLSVQKLFETLFLDKGDQCIKHGNIFMKIEISPSSSTWIYRVFMALLMPQTVWRYLFGSISRVHSETVFFFWPRGQIIKHGNIL